MEDGRTLSTNWNTIIVRLFGECRTSSFKFVGGSLVGNEYRNKTKRMSNFVLHFSLSHFDLHVSSVWANIAIAIASSNDDDDRTPLIPNGILTIDRILV